MKIVILYSGGSDSLVLKKMAEVEHPGAEVVCLFFNYGQQGVEIEALPSYVTIRDIDCGGRTDHLPGGNMVFSTLAAAQELPDEIWIGTTVDEYQYTDNDKNGTFRQSCSTLISYVLSPYLDLVNVKFPLVERNMTKLDSIKWAFSHGITEEEIKGTITCRNYSHKHRNSCGICRACLKRWLTFTVAGISSDSFVCHPLNSELQAENIRYYVDRVKRGLANTEESHIERLIRKLNILT